MDWSRLVLAVLVFSISPSVLAVCRFPLPPGDVCCNFTDTLDMPAFFRTGRVQPALVSDRIVNDVQSPTRQNCTISAQVTVGELARAAGCATDYRDTRLLPVTTYGAVIGGSQSFTIQHYAYQVLAPGIGVCLTAQGSATWDVAPPPPPPVACQIPDLPPIPPTADACTRSLEDNNGLANSAVCPAIPVLSRTGGEPCLRRKLTAAGVAYGGPTSTIRTAVYQEHIRQVWLKSLEHRFISDPAEYEECAAKRAVVEAERRRHGLVYEPADDSRHTQGRAFDISPATIAAVERATGRPVNALLSSVSPGSPACTLTWGGIWRRPDRVHFELNVP